LKKPVKDTIVEEKIENLKIDETKKENDEILENDIVEENNDDKQDLDPIKILEDFSEKSKTLEEKITTNNDNYEEVLKQELEEAQKIETELEKNIQKKEEVLKNKKRKVSFTELWNGIGYSY
jgi:hypothetical protein